jgi:hypothetical protein
MFVVEKISYNYQSLKAQRVRIGTQDLRIASIVLACDSVFMIYSIIVY